MKHYFTFKTGYFLWAILILGIEVLIALYVHDAIIRPYIGDVLVVILLYCFVKSILNISVLKAALSVFIFAYAIEMLQYFKIVNKLGLQDVTFARIIIGTDFSWIDMLAYTLGIAMVLGIERSRR